VRQTQPVERRKHLFKLSNKQICSITFLLAAMFIASGLRLPALAQSDKPSMTEPFSPPKGAFAVGTHEYLWIDQKRDEPFTKDPADRRHLLARVWYPAQPVAGKEVARYVLNAGEFPEKSIYRRGENIKTNAITDAPIAKAKERFPVLVYQPGGGTARFIGTFQAEEFASQGYVVISADHPGFSETILFPDGFRFQADRMTAPKETGNFRDDVLKSWDWLEKEVFPTWVADATYTLDKLAELDRTSGGPFYKRLDLTRIGMLGWSFGGATAVQMSRIDPRIKAVVDQDGQLFGEVRDKGTSRPLMLMHHGNEDKPPKPEQAEVMKEMVAKTKAYDKSLLEHSSNDWYEITIAKTQHGHFSDFLLFFPANPKELVPRRAHEIIIAYTLAFFDKYLRGKNSDLLKAPSESYPEVTFNKRK
jgi:predicted dienelactone hydrolase